MTTNTSRGARLLAALFLIATVGLVFASPADAKGKNKDITYSFTFVNGTTISGTATSNEVFLPNAGGTNAANPIGMTVHVSCSDDFPGGFGEKDGPDRNRDSAWQIQSFSISKDGGKKTCGDDFTPPGPPPVPAIQIVKTVNGQDANEAPGPEVEVGMTVTLGYTVTNTGNIALSEVVVTDDDLGVIGCPRTTLAVDASMVCDTRTMDVTQPGQVFMKARVDAIGATNVTVPTPGDKKEKAYVFVFENGTVISGVSDDNEAFIANAGGTSVDNPIGMILHVSCSDEFPNGWGEKDGPDSNRDSAWRIASYRIVKDNKTCGDANGTIRTPVMDMDPINYFAVDTPEPPRPPLCLLQVIADDDVRVIWTASEGATNYELLRNGTVITTTTDRAFTDVNPPTGIDLRYQVRAIGPDGVSNLSDCGVVRIPDDPTPPNPPVPPVCVAELVHGSNDVKITWNDVDGASEYLVIRNGSIVKTTPATMYLDRNRPAGVVLRYEVIAKGPGGKSAKAFCGKVIIPEDPEPPVVPPAPECTVSVIGGDQVKVTWDAVDGANKYAVKRNGTWLDQVRGTQYMDTNPPTGVELEYSVRSIGDDGKSGYASCGTVRIDDEQPPVDFRCHVVDSLGKAVVDWTAVPGAKAYQVRLDGKWQVRTTELWWADEHPRGGTYTVEAVFKGNVKSEPVVCGSDS